MSDPIFLPQPEQSSTSGWVAGFALFLAIIAIIFIIIVVFLFSRDTETVAELVDFWIVVPSGTTGTQASPMQYTASPNSILAVNAGIPVGFNTNIVPYANVATNVTAGSRTSIFKIVNTLSAQSVAVTFSEGTILGTGTPGTVAAGTSAEYMWVSSTTVQRIS